MSAAASTARAVWFAAARRVEVRDQVVPSPGPGEVRVRAIASGISAGSEMLVFRGEVPDDLPLDLPTLEGSFAFPVKYGYASVGRVAETGDDVRGLSPGDLVFVHHPHQSEFVVDAALIVPLPDVTDAVVAVLVANLETAVNVVLDARPRLGDSAVVVGQGVVGQLIGMALRRAGAAQVIAVDPVPWRRSLATELGADLALEPGSGLRGAVREATGGRGADLVVEASSSPAALQSAIDCAGLEATVVVCSWYGTRPVTVGLGGAFHRGRLRVVSSQVGALDPALGPRWDIARRRSLAVRLLAELPVARLVTHRFDVEDAGAAYALVDSGAGDALQVVLTHGADV